MRIILAAIAGFAVAWLLGDFFNFIPAQLQPVFEAIMAGTIAGYIARRSGWLAGLISSLLDAGMTIFVFLSMFHGINQRSGIAVPFPPIILWRLAGLTLVATFAGHVGQKWYEIGVRWREKSPT